MDNNNYSLDNIPAEDIVGEIVDDNDNLGMTLVENSGGETADDNDSFGKALAETIGYGMADTKIARDKRLRDKKAAIKKREEKDKANRAKLCYEYTCFELSEVLRAAAEVFDFIDENIAPKDLRLVFDGSKFIDKIMPFEYRLPKLSTSENSPEHHIRILQATINKIILDRFNQGLCPSVFSVPVQCRLKKWFNEYAVSVFALENEVQDIPPLFCNPGQYVGRFRYDNPCDRFYVDSIKSQTIYIGDKFHIADKGVFVEAVLKQGGMVYVSSRDTLYPASHLLRRMARIAKKEI